MTTRAEHLSGTWRPVWLSIQRATATGVGALWGSFWGLLFGILFFVPIFGLALNAAMGALAGHIAHYGMSKHTCSKQRVHMFAVTRFAGKKSKRCAL